MTQYTRKLALDLLRANSKRVGEVFSNHHGEGVVAACPFHKGGEEEKPSFYWNLSSGLFTCHACGVAGAVRDFLHLTGCSPTDLAEILKEIEEEKTKEFALPDSVFERKRQQDVLRINPVIPEWYMGTFNYTPNTLINKGFPDTLLQEHGIGYDIARQRIVYPIRDLYGNLIGLSGRDDGGWEDRRGVKYKFYRSELQDLIEGYSLEKSVTLWNGHRLWARYVVGFYHGLPPPTVIITEGFNAALRVLQAGFLDTVALMGVSLSEAQRYALCLMGGTVVLFLDNNKAGREGTAKAYKNLIHNTPLRVRAVKYPQDAPEGFQPDDFTVTELQQLIEETVK